jgi:low affinity Fe/Cu permease
MENLDSSGKSRARFGKAAAKTAGWVGAPWAFVLALLSVVIWGLLGPYYKYSDTPGS